MKKNEAKKYFPTQILIDKIFDDREKQKCSNCKFKKNIRPQFQLSTPNMRKHQFVQQLLYPAQVLPVPANKKIW